MNYQWYFVGIIVEIDEAIIEEESWVTLPPVAIINLLSPHDIIWSFNYKTLSFITEIPRGLLRSLMVQHVCKRNKTICFNIVYLDTENTTRYNHPHFRILFQCKLFKVWHFFANQIIIRLDIINLFQNLIQKWTALQILHFLIRKENWEIIQTLRQNIQVLKKLNIIFLLLLKDIRTQKWMFGWNELVSQSFLIHLLPNWGLESHF